MHQRNHTVLLNSIFDTKLLCEFEEKIEIEMKFCVILASIIGICAIFVSAQIEPKCDCSCPRKPAPPCSDLTGPICNCPDCVGSMCDCSCPPKPWQPGTIPCPCLPCADPYPDPKPDPKPEPECTPLICPGFVGP